MRTLPTILVGLSLCVLTWFANISSAETTQTATPGGSVEAVDVQDSLREWVAADFSSQATGTAGPCESIVFYNLTPCTQHLIFYYDCDGDGEWDEAEDIFLDPVTEDDGPSIRIVTPHCRVVDIRYGGSIPIDCGANIEVRDCAVLFY